MAWLFNSLAGFAGFINARLLRRMPIASHAILEHAAKMMEDEAKRVLGTYDYGWPRLAESTIESKATGDSPGLETGEMRDSIHHHVTVDEFTGEGNAWIGSDHDRALWFELGTRHQPPRPFLSVAASHMSRAVADMIGARAHAFLSTGEIDGKGGEVDQTWNG